MKATSAESICLNAEFGEAIGLPPIWKTVNEGWKGVPDLSYLPSPIYFDLSDYQTRQGVLRQLAMWADDDGEGAAYWLSMYGTGWTLCRVGANPAEPVEITGFTFSERIARAAGQHWVPLLGTSSHPDARITAHAEALAAIVEWVGKCAAIRRKKGRS